MRFTVKSYNSAGDFHVCKDEQGFEHYFDLMVAALVDLKPEEFIGRTFEAPDGSIRPYVSIVNEFEELK